MISTARIAGSSLLASVFFAVSATHAFASPSLVTSDVNGSPLVADEANPQGFFVQDVSADGRYVVLNNTPRYVDAAFGTAAGMPDTCRILRKDRQTGELITVFEDTGDQRYCGNAKISADGNIVVTAPQRLVDICAPGTPLVIPVTAVAARNVAAGTTTEIPGEATLSANDIARICLGNPIITPVGGGVVSGLASDGNVALLGGSNSFGFGLDANLDGLYDSPIEIANFSTLSVQEVEFGEIDPNTNQRPLAVSAALSEDGTQVAILGFEPAPLPPLPPRLDVGAGGQPTGPSTVIICGQVGRCDRIGVAPISGSPYIGTVPPDGSSYSWWAWGSQPPVYGGSGTYAITLVDVATGVETQPPALTDFDGIPRLNSNAWSADGSQLSFLLLPENNTLVVDGTCEGAECELRVARYSLTDESLATVATPYDMDTLSNCRPALPVNIAGGLGCLPQLSRDGGTLLYPRAVAYPFGGDWQPISVPSTAVTFTCVSQDTGEIVDCPTNDLLDVNSPINGGSNYVPNTGNCFIGIDATGNPNPTVGPLDNYGCPEGQALIDYFLNPNSGENADLGGLWNPADVQAFNQYNKQVTSVYVGQIPDSDPLALNDPNLVPAYWWVQTQFQTLWATRTDYTLPVIWYTLDVDSGQSTVVSVTNEGQLFQTRGALLSDDGSTVIFNSQDPRLNTADPAALADEEAALDPACFWSPAGSASNLRVATNDNVAFLAADGFDVYRETPVFCPVPNPPLQQQAFAKDLTDGVNTAVLTLRSMRNGPNAMQTWIGNFARTAATMVAVDIEIEGLSSGASVRLIDADGCEVWPATADTGALIRCEYPALQSFAFRPLIWELEGEGMAMVTTRISSNEAELMPMNNTDTDRVRLLNNRWARLFGMFRRGR